MSRRAEQWVWDNSETNGNDRMVLVYMGNEANDEGFACFPSMERLARKCRISTNTVASVIKRLEAGGEIVVLRPERQGRGHFNQYALVLGRNPGTVMEALRKGAKSLPLSESDNGATDGAKRRDQPREKARPDRDVPIDRPIDRPVAAQSAAAEKDDTLHRTAHKLTVLAFEQPIKPTLRSDGDAFAAVMGIIASKLHAGYSANDLRAVIEAGVDVWTANGLGTALSQRRRTRFERPDPTRQDLSAKSPPCVHSVDGWVPAADGHGVERCRECFTSEATG